MAIENRIHKITMAFSENETGEGHGHSSIRTSLVHVPAYIYVHKS